MAHRTIVLLPNENFHCGACTYSAPDFLHLHSHVQAHTESGNYYYHNASKTVYPRHDVICNETQTVWTCCPSLLFQGVNKQFDDINRLCNTELAAEKSEAIQVEQNRSIENVKIKVETELNEWFSDDGHDLETVHGINFRAAVSSGPDEQYEAKNKETDINFDNVKIKVEPETSEQGSGYEPDLTKIDCNNSIVDGNFHIEDNSNSSSDTDVSHSRMKYVFCGKPMHGGAQRKANGKKNCQFAGELVVPSLDKRTKKMDGLGNEVEKSSHKIVCQSKTEKERTILEESVEECDLQMEVRDDTSEQEYSQMNSCSEVHINSVKGNDQATKGIAIMDSVCAKVRKTANNVDQKPDIKGKEKEHQCMKCGSIFTDLGLFKEHFLKCIKESNLEKKEHICKKCCSSFANFGIFQQHFKKCQKNVKGKEVKAKLCDMCGSSFLDRLLFKQHVKKCQRKPLVCNICGKQVKTKYHLDNHMAVHKKDPNFYCDRCGKKFNHQRSLNYHLSRQHDIGSSHKCSKCDKTFFSKCTLQRHERVHDKIRPHVCQYCGKTCSERWNLMAHMRQHTGEKPYKCAVCGAAFTHNVVRKSHEANCRKACE